MGAAWVTKTFWKYKLVVVNAWVDIPEEHELEVEAHAAMHHGKQRPKTPVKRMWGSIVGKAGKKDSVDIGPLPSGNSDVEGYDGETDEVKLTKYEKSEEKLHVQESRDDFALANNNPTNAQIQRSEQALLCQRSLC